MSGRAQRMEEDVQAVIAACQADQACPFRSESRSKIMMYLEPNIRSFAPCGFSQQKGTLTWFIYQPIHCRGIIYRRSLHRHSGAV